jgi:hypothetical protein
MKDIYWIFAVVYTFIEWGFGWGLLSILIPVFPMIDLVKWILNK